MPRSRSYRTFTGASESCSACLRRRARSVFRFILVILLRFRLDLLLAPADMQARTCLYVNASAESGNATRFDKRQDVRESVAHRALA